MVYFIPTTERITAEELARLFRDNMWKLHRVASRQVNAQFNSRKTLNTHFSGLNH